MSERRRRYSFYETGHTDPIIEERRPEVIELRSTSKAQRLTSNQRARSPVILRRKTVIYTSTPVHSRRKERVERSPAPVRYLVRPRAPTPPPRLYTPPLQSIMPPKQTPAPRPLSMPQILPQKKEDNKPKAGTRPGDKSKDGPRVKIYEKSHKQSNSFDTGYASGSGFSSPSPWSVEERSPLDYLGASTMSPINTTTTPKSPKPRVDKEPYEIITASSKSRYIKTGSDRTSDRTKDVSATTERKRDPRYVVRTPDSPGVEAEIMPTLSTKPAKPTKPSKDDYAPTRRATQVLQEQLTRGSERSTPSEDSQRLKQLQADLEKLRLERQIAEGRAAEAERRLKQQKVDELERRGRELKRQQAEEQQKREASLARREAKLAKKQWEEIEATPPSSTAPPRRSATLVEQGQVSRRQTLVAPYGSGALTTTTLSPSLLDTENPFLAPILEAQRDEDARRAREGKEDRRRGTVVKETARSVRPRRRDGEDRYHI